MARTGRHDVPMALAVMPGADIDAGPDSGGRPHPTFGVVPEPELQSVAGLHHDGCLHYVQTQLAFQNPQAFQTADARLFVEVDQVNYFAGDDAPVRLWVAVGELTDGGRVGAGIDLPCADPSTISGTARLLGFSVHAAAGACSGPTVDAVAGVDGAKAFSQGDQS